MRKDYLVAALAISAIAVSGCQTTSPYFNIDPNAGTGTGGTFGGGGTGTGTGTGTGGTGTGTGGTGTGSSTGTSTGQVLTEGATTFAFNDAGTTTDGSALAQVTITNAGGGLGVETAEVAVDVNQGGLTWSDMQTMTLFRNTIASLPGVPELGGNYSEYRHIASDSDAELQLWEFNHSSVAQYSVYFDDSAPNNNNVALFFEGNPTDEANLPAATATFNGQFGGVAVASNWIERQRAVDDPCDPGNPAGFFWSPNGTWRVTGDTQIVADFAAGTVNGSITNTTWRHFEPSQTSPDGYITITPAETSRPFHDYTMTGTIDGNTYSGQVLGPVGQFVTGDNALQGGFFGPNAEETAGIVRSFTTTPQPSDGISPNEENRRGFIDIRGVFHGSQ